MSKMTAIIVNIVLIFLVIWLCVYNLFQGGANGFITALAIVASLASFAISIYSLKKSKALGILFIVISVGLLIMDWLFLIAVGLSRGLG